MAPTRIWLDVPYAEKDQAKAAGARWDAAARRWYAPRPGMDALAEWTALPPVPDLLPGEDRSFGHGLFVDLVPKSCWFTNVRSCVSERDWERLRHMITSRAGQRCEACRRPADRDTGRWLEAHERWSYDDETRVQSLRRLICLCTDCHQATHYGLATVQGTDAQARAHLRAVTGFSAADIDLLIEAAFELWAQRSRYDWALDLSILTDAGVTVRRPPAASERARAAQRELGR
ncbi:MAG TPA: DUF5710 domain-containing protein [Trebonia sp.]|jgi:hypothetical protein|nr:DUF5710 domain-containing protein [Trebonia sp.]